MSSCIFCDSIYHNSEFCRIYSSNESREKKLRSKKYCDICVLPLEGEKHGWFSCKKRLKCYVCFCRHHHSVFCPERNSKMFLPKIDADLIPRFCRILDPFEKYPIAFSCQKNLLSSIQLKPLKIHKQLLSSEISNFDKEETISVFDDKISLKYREITYSQKIFPALSSKTVAMKAKFVILQCFPMFTFEELCIFLTPYVKKLLLQKINFLPHIKFGEIMKNIPDVQYIDLKDTTNAVWLGNSKKVNNIITNSWPEELTKHKNGNDFKRLNIEIPSLNLNHNALAKFMKTKCSKNAAIILHSLLSFEEFEKLPSKLSKNFVEVEIKTRQNAPTLKFVSSINNQTQKWFIAK